MAEILTLSRPAPRPPKQPNLSARLLRHCIDTARLAGRPLSLGLLLEILSSAPRSQQELADDDWAVQSVCWRCINEIEFRLDVGQVAEAEYYRIADFWTKDFAGQDAGLRANVMTLLALLSEAFRKEGRSGHWWDDKENLAGGKMKTPKKSEDIESDKAQLAALGGEPLAGSGFEDETPEDGLSYGEVTVIGRMGSGKRSSLFAELEKAGMTLADGSASASADFDEPDSSGPPSDQIPV